MTAFYHVTDRRTGNARFLLADLLFGVGKSQRTTATNVFCRSVAGRDGCCDLQAALICPQTALDVIPLWTSRSKEVDDPRITVLVWHRALA